MIRRQIRHKTRNRRVIQDTAPARPGDATPTFILGAPTTSFLIDFDFPMVLQQSTPLPIGITVTQDAPPVATAVLSIEQVTLTQWRVTCADTLDDPVVVTIPDQWPLLRTNMGGFVTPGEYTFAGVP